jgi:hypothetical protein
LSGLLTDEERENFSAALARRPLVKGFGATGDVHVVLRQAVTQLRKSQPVVREIGFTSGPVSNPASR